MPEPRPYLARRADDWQNVNTRLGVRNKDKRVSTAYEGRLPLDQEELEALYRFAWLAARIVRAYPEQMTRKWGCTKVEGDEDLGKRVDARLEELDARGKVCDAMTWARLYGGAVVLVGADDAPVEGLHEALRVERIRRVRYLHVLDRHYLSPETWDGSPDSETWGEPLTYRVTPSRARASSPQTFWHASRVLRFDGNPLPERLRDENDGWHAPVLDEVFDALRDHGQALGGAATAAGEFALSVLKVRGLADELAAMPAQAGKDLATRLEQFQLQLRAGGLAVIDAELEEYLRLGHTVTGLPEVLDRLFDQVVGASGIPRAILLGQAIGTTRAGADTDVLAFYDRVETMQRNVLVPRMERLIRMVFSELGVPEPAEWDWAPNPLWALDDKEKAEVHKSKSEAAVGLVNAGIASPIEVRPALMESGGYEPDEEFERALEEPPDLSAAPAAGQVPQSGGEDLDDEAA